MNRIKGFVKRHQSHNRWLVFATLLLGVLLDSISWPSGWGVVVPDVTPLILLYWVMALANSNFLITAFFFGLLHDVLYHTGMGTYALIYCLMVYPLLHVRLQLRNKTLLQMALFMGGWMLVHQLLVWLITPANHLAAHNIAFWLAALVSALIWPLIFILLRTLRRNAHIR
jgi:rod shape-determining protein MreD